MGCDASAVVLADSAHPALDRTGWPGLESAEAPERARGRRKMGGIRDSTEQGETFRGIRRACCPGHADMY